MAKSLGAFDRLAPALADAALAAATREAFRREALATLRSLVAFDFGIIWSIPESLDDATLVGVPPEIWHHYFAERERFGRDIAPLVRVALERGVVNDRELFDARQRDRLGFYLEIIRPVGSRNFLTAIMGAPRHGVTAIQLGRAGRHGSLFSDSDQGALRRLLPVLSLGEALHQRSTGGALEVPPSFGPGDEDPAVTHKEREVLELFEHGASYQDVARILQISINTVRDHVRNIYEKLHVTSKVEAVMKLRQARSTP